MYSCKCPGCRSFGVSQAYQRGGCAMPGRRADGKLPGARPCKQTLSSRNACKAKRVVNPVNARKPKGVVNAGRDCKCKRAFGVSPSKTSESTTSKRERVGRTYLPQYLGGKPRPKWHSGRRQSPDVWRCKVADLEAQLSCQRQENENLKARLWVLEDQLDWERACNVSGMPPPPSPTARGVHLH